MKDTTRLVIAMPSKHVSETGSYPPIGDYALIGDCRGAGLVALDGSLDWLCVPRFDSPPIFAALLDAERGGRFRIRPAGPFRAERRYLPDTNILETTFWCADGACVLRDWMAVASEEEQRAMLRPEHEVLREVEGLSGEVELEIVYEPRPDYGRSSPRLAQRGVFGLWCQAGQAIIILRSEVALRVARDGLSAHGVARIRAGEHSYFSLSYSREAPAVIPPLGDVARRKREQTARWWQDWAGRCSYQGPYRAAVVRSALALKLMTYAPSGAIVAAPTTSLPEKLGGSSNWDYRYCWLRDAAFTLRAFFTLGYTAEAEAFLNWMLHATRLTWPELQMLYNVFGESYVPEQELPHLAGYAGSRPVRIGNDAHDQFQLDVYGEVIDAVAFYASHGIRFDRDTIRMLNGLGSTVCKRWREPDHGIWEERSGRCHYTHSKVLCWIALDRLIQIAELGYRDLAVEQFRSERAAIRAEIEARGYNPQIQSYTRTFDGDELDASLLALPLYGYIDAAHPRMRATYDRICQRLARGQLIQRHETRGGSGLSSGEGAFGICSFWAVECLARRGDRQTAAQMFETLLTYANAVGLFAEEIDPDTGAVLGNFPQAFTHIGLINAALVLAEHERGDQVGREQRRTPAVEERT